MAKKPKPKPKQNALSPAARAEAQQKRDAQQNARSFIPTRVPERPPPGSYDPALDAAEGQTQTGFSDLLDDAAKKRTRGLGDYGLSRGDLTRQRDERLADVGRSRTRGEEDFASRLGGLQRQFRILGDNQRQAANARGVSQGGTLAASAAKRAENEAYDRQPLDVARTRLGEDLDQDVTRTGEAHDRGVGALDLNYQRTFGPGQDMDVALARAARDTGQFSIDTGRSRNFQAMQNNYDPLADKPRNEFTTYGAGGERLDYRTLGGGRVRVPSGQTLRVPKGRKGASVVRRNQNLYG